jgi:hypothetical protein
MLTPGQAVAFADTVLEQQKRDHLEARNRRAAPVRWFYRVAGLSDLEPWQQAELVAEAAWRAVRSLGFWAVLSVCVALVVAAGLLWTDRKPLAYLLCPVILLFGKTVHAWFVRRKLAEMLAEPGAVNTPR